MERLLSNFMDRGRLRRAVEIGDDELNLEEEKPNPVRARIREHVAAIDLDKKTILHNCADWARCIPEKTFCKHVAKIFLTLPEAEAKRILREIDLEKDSWQFLQVY